MRRYSCCCLLPAFLPLPATSQAVHPGSIASIVVDASGAPIAGAHVMLVPIEGTSRSMVDAKTGSKRHFFLPALEGVAYTLTVDEEGFRTKRLLVVGSKRVPELRLALSSIMQGVEVSGTSGHGEIETQESEGGLSLDAQAIGAIPLNGRSFTDELAVAPGVIPVSSVQPNAVVMSGAAITPPSGNLDIGALSVSGQRETANAFHVNGSDV